MPIQQPSEDGELRERLLKPAREHPRFGAGRLSVLLGREQTAVNHKKVRRVYHQQEPTVMLNPHKKLTRTPQL